MKTLLLLVQVMCGGDQACEQATFSHCRNEKTQKIREQCAFYYSQNVEKVIDTYLGACGKCRGIPCRADFKLALKHKGAKIHCYFYPYSADWQSAHPVHQYGKYDWKRQEWIAISKKEYDKLKLPGTYDK